MYSVHSVHCTRLTRRYLVFFFLQISQRQEAQRIHARVHGRRPAVTDPVGATLGGHRPARGHRAAENPRVSGGEHDEWRGNVGCSCKGRRLESESRPHGRIIDEPLTGTASDGGHLKAFLFLCTYTPNGLFMGKTIGFDSSHSYHPLESCFI